MDEEETCNNCGKNLKPKDYNYWDEKLLCGDCWDLEYAEARHGMGFKI